MVVVTNDIKQKACSLEQLSSIAEESNIFCSDPERYLEPTIAMKDGLLSVSKKLYDFMKDFETYVNKGSSLDELLISGFDNEQVWQQIELQNSSCLPKFKSAFKDFYTDDLYLNQKKAKKSVSERKRKKREIKKPEKILEPEDNKDDNEETGDDEFIDEDGDDIKTMVMKNYKSTAVDDQFFHLRQMEDFLDQFEQGEAESENTEGKRLFQETNDNDDENFTFNDFFDPPVKSKNKQKEQVGNGEEGVGVDLNNEEINDQGDNGTGAIDDNDLGPLDDDIDLDSENESDDDGIDISDLGGNDDQDLSDLSEKEDNNDFNEKEEENIDESKAAGESTFEKKQKQMQKKIQKLEEENISEKPWQLMGEAVAKKRPLNSLLEEFVTFDHTSVGAPTITEETTLSLEEIIKQRIKDQAWDDVKRKEKPVTQAFEYKKAPELNQEKSKVSLAEVYEKEYMKQMEEEKEDKENEEHVEIQKLMDKLFVQLDSLSNFHFTPKPPQPEIKIISNAPSLQMEEVLPVTMTESSQLAPEEVHEKKRGDLVGDEEKTEEDRKRERRQKKIKKKFAAKAREKKEKSGKIAKSKGKEALDTIKKGSQNTIVKTKGVPTDKSTKSSSQFFDKLQDEVKKTITKQTAKEKVLHKTKKTAESLKL